MIITTCGTCVNGYTRPTRLDPGEPCGCEKFFCDECGEELTDKEIGNEQDYCNNCNQEE